MVLSARKKTGGVTARNTLKLSPQDKQKQPWTSENEMSSEIVASLLERKRVRERTRERESQIAFSLREHNLTRNVNCAGARECVVLAGS